MNRGWYITAGMLALLGAGPAFAEDEANDISNSELGSRWNVEVGTRYWYSSGTTEWNHTTAGGILVPPGIIVQAGDPTSVLVYDDLEAHSGEAFFRIDDQLSRLFLKGYVGAGGVVDGSLDDEDFGGGGGAQVKFSDTLSSVNDGDLAYASIDAGWTVYEGRGGHGHDDAAMAPGVRFGIFAGYHYWNENVHAYGISCNADDFGNLAPFSNCQAPPGTQVVSSSINVISNEVTWHSVRLGLDGTWQINNRVGLSGEVAWIPYAVMDNDDSHHLRADLGPVPNIRHEGSGYGVQLEAVLSAQLTERFSLGVGSRYWHLESDGTVEFGSPVLGSEELNDFDSTRYGVFVQGSVKLF